LKNPIAYTALSYCWGTELAANPLIVDDHKMAITANLDLALRYIRDDTAAMILWVDAVCINQADDAEALEERSYQILKMAEIYSKAGSIIAWLGTELESDQLVVDFVESHLQQPLYMHATQLLMDPAYMPTVQAFLEICKRDYWLRVWTVQEAVCACTFDSVLLKIGKHNINWEYFFRLAIMFISKTQELSRILGPLPKGFDAVCNRLKIQRLISQDETWPLLKLLEALRGLECTFSADHVFGVLGIAEESRQGFFALPYSKDAAEVFTKTSMFIIQHTRSLKLLAGSGIIMFDEKSQIGISNLPSWVPDWSLPKRLMSLQSELTEDKEFAASGNFAPTPDFSLASRAITVQGCLIGEVVTAGPICPNGSLEKYWDETLKVLAQWFPQALVLKDNQVDPEVSEQNAIEFWWVLYGGRPRGPRGPRGIPLPNQVSGTVEGDDEFPPGFNVEVYDMVTSASLGNQVHVAREKVSLYMQKCLQFIMYRRFITSGSVMGLAPPQSNIGDQIVILAGFDTPVILHQVDDHWIYRGEAYIHGYMHGEVLEEINKGKRSWSTITIH
jgi:hypothetical protein